MTKFKSQALHTTRIKCWKASGNGKLPSLIPTFWKIAIYVLNMKFYVLFCSDILHTTVCIIFKVILSCLDHFIDLTFDNHSHLFLFLSKKNNSFCHPFIFYFLQNQSKFGVFIFCTKHWTWIECFSCLLNDWVMTLILKPRKFRFFQHAALVSIPSQFTVWSRCILIHRTYGKPVRQKARKTEMVSALHKKLLI